MDAATFAGTFSATGDVTLGNGTGDDITITGSIAANIPIKTDGSFDLGAATLGMQVVYFGDGGGNTIGVQAPAIAANFLTTLPATATVMPSADGAAKDYLQTDGSGNWSFVGGPGITTKDDTYTLTTADKVLSVDTNANGAWSLTLYTPVGADAGRVHTLYKATSDLNALTIIGTINGISNSSINTQWEKLTLMCTGSNFVILDRKSNSAPLAFTPTGGWSSNVTYTGTIQRKDNTAEIIYYVDVTGTPTTASLTLNMPSGYTIDTARYPSYADDEIDCFRSGFVLNGGVGRYPILACRVTDSSTLSPILFDNSGTSLHQAANITASFPHGFGAGDHVILTVVVPIAGWKTGNE